jgi:CRISPR system Cascade subunit CasE
MIVTKLCLNQHSIKKLRISDSYSIHRVVYSLFDRLNSESDRLLYSDLGGDFFNHVVLIMSNKEPNVQNLPDGVIVNTRSIPDDLFSFGHYRFKTKLNVSRRDSKTKKIVPIKSRDEISSWFLKKSPDSWGFLPLKSNLEIEKVEGISFHGKNNNLVTINQVTFSGILKVEDLEKFRKSFFSGLGRGKAFGCGLLEIYPIKNINN